LRTSLNEREDELLSEVDKKYNETFDNLNIIKESEKLPNKIKISIEKGNSMNSDWDDINKLSSLISNCNNIEENINNIKIIIDCIKKYQINKDANIELILEDDNYNNYMKNIKLFWKIIIKETKIDSSIIKNKGELKEFYNLLSNQIVIKDIIKLLL